MIRQNDDEELALRVDPHRGAGEPGMAECALTHALAAAGAAGTGVPSQRTPSGAVTLEAIDGAVAGDPDTPRGPAVEERERETRQVVRGGEEPGMARDATESPGVAVMHDAGGERQDRKSTRLN